MVTSVPTARPDDTVKDVLDLLVAPEPTYDTTAYIFVTDKEGVLEGVVSLKDAINKPHDKKMKHLMSERVVSVRPSTDQEIVAQKAIKYRLKSVPVVDAKRRLLGVIPSHTIYDILHWEHTEDMLRMAGLHAKGLEMRTAVKAGILKMSWFRLPSLLIGVFGGLALTSVVDFFHESLEDQLILAFFIPLMLYLSAAMATQTGTILVRTLATEQVNIWKYALRELIIGLVMASVIGSAMFAVVQLWHGSSIIALVIGLSLFLCMSIASVLGVAIPLIIARLKQDPAVSGGPIINMFQDIVTLTVYFSVATALLL